MKQKIIFAVAFTCLLFSSTLFAVDSKNFGEYSVDYTTFPSTAITSEIASIYGIKRSAYETLINVFVSKQGQQGGLDLNIRGSAKNLMGQQQTLQFLEIKEDNTVYYIAPIRVSGKEEVLHITIEAELADGSQRFDINFSKTFYTQ